MTNLDNREKQLQVESPNIWIRLKYQLLYLKCLRPNDLHSKIWEPATVWLRLLCLGVCTPCLLLVETKETRPYGDIHMCTYFCVWVPIMGKRVDCLPELMRPHASLYVCRRIYASISDLVSLGFATTRYNNPNERPQLPPLLLSVRRLELDAFCASFYATKILNHK